MLLVIVLLSACSIAKVSLLTIQTWDGMSVKLEKMTNHITKSDETITTNDAMDIRRRRGGGRM